MSYDHYPVLANCDFNWLISFLLAACTHVYGHISFTMNRTLQWVHLESVGIISWTLRTKCMPFSQHATRLPHGTTMLVTLRVRVCRCTVPCVQYMQYDMRIWPECLTVSTYTSELDILHLLHGAHKYNPTPAMEIDLKSKPLKLFYGWFWLRVEQFAI